MDLLLLNRDKLFAAPEIDLEVVKEFKNKISDEGYFIFLLEISNGGFFFDQSLHLYGLSKAPNFHSIKFVNEFMQHEYGKLIDGCVFFAQDIFGNQFAYKNGGIAQFNIETADIEPITVNFNGWLTVLKDDLEYLTGKGFVTMWNETNTRLECNQRLCAKKPFIIGGEYSTTNFYAQHFPTFISSNANIARQIHDLPDGTKINLKID